MSATAEAVTISRPDTGTIFLSRRQDLRLIRRARYEVRGAGGEVVDQIRGEAYQFADNRLYVPASGTMKTDTRQDVDAGEVREWLESHPLHDDIENGFWQLVQPPPAVSKEEFDAVVNAAMAFEEDALLAIIAQEESGWNRAEYLASVRDALERMRAAMAKLEAQQAEAEAKPKAKPAPKAE